MAVGLGTVGIFYEVLTENGLLIIRYQATLKYMQERRDLTTLRPFLTSAKGDSAIRMHCRRRRRRRSRYPEIPFFLHAMQRLDWMCIGEGDGGFGLPIQAHSHFLSAFLPAAKPIMEV